MDLAGDGDGAAGRGVAGGGEARNLGLGVGGVLGLGVGGLAGAGEEEEAAGVRGMVGGGGGPAEAAARAGRGGEAGAGAPPAVGGGGRWLRPAEAAGESAGKESRRRGIGRRWCFVRVILVGVEKKEEGGGSAACGAYLRRRRMRHIGGPILIFHSSTSKE